MSGHQGLGMDNGEVVAIRSTTREPEVMGRFCILTVLIATGSYTHTNKCIMYNW